MASNLNANQMDQSSASVVDLASHFVLRQVEKLDLICFYHALSLDGGPYGARFFIFGVYYFVMIAIVMMILPHYLSHSLLIITSLHLLEYHRE
jgi:hypothetical protein